MVDDEGGPLSRTISAMIAVVYLVGALAAGGAEVASRVLLFCIVPVACIWFPDVLGDYTGIFLLDSITTKSPAGFVWFLDPPRPLISLIVPCQVLGRAMVPRCTTASA
jgi:hypothetical protein